MVEKRVFVVLGEVKTVRLSTDVQMCEVVLMPSHHRLQAEACILNSEGIVVVPVAALPDGLPIDR